MANYYKIGISSSLPHINQQLAMEISSREKGGLLVIYRYSEDMERFIRSLERVDLDYTYAGLDYTLSEKGFEFVPRVENIGEFSRIGEVISFWPIGYIHPVRIEFFDEKIEKIYTYDELYNQSIDKLDHIYISSLDILDDRVDWDNLEFIKPNSKKTNLIEILNLSEFEPPVDLLTVLIFGNDLKNVDKEIDLNLSYPNLYYSNLEIFHKEFLRLQEANYEIYLNTDKKDVLSRFRGFKRLDFDLDAGLVDKSKKIVVFTEREILGNVFLAKEKKKKINSRKARKLLDEIEGEIEIGDYLVHEDHGVGIYSGLIREEDNEYILLKYAKSDELMVPINQIHRITKYIGVSNEPPEITTLNKITWKETTKKIKATVKLMAGELVSHYAKLALATTKPQEIQNPDKFEKFLAGFEYVETEDQKRAIAEVLKDMASKKPMNRLLVGDVGFGKTEVALRASYNAVDNGYQVAILCPTTVLAAQHYQVLKDRFRDLEVKIAMLSRFNDSFKNKDNVKDLKDGKIDIVVGTHRLLSNDVGFKNLGLIVLDEEQKFGVKQKEKIKKLKYGVHVLSMTATPIPRTLSMALSEIQDISIISTPPQGRRAVKTIVTKKNWANIVEAISYEIKRKGQVYFVHNRVQSIYSILYKLESLMPKVKFVVAHGQMDEGKLEKVINDFYEKRYDCLISTTIIENGIDMPNVNTIIIDKAQNLGLGQLYQLRGRVGRSTAQAYAYIFYDGEDIDKADKKGKESMDADTPADIRKIMDRKYVKRLKAIEEASELGAGFEIASRDLEIRGAGNLLGQEQHGHISKIGLALYMQMLAEEIEKQQIAREV